MFRRKTDQRIHVDESKASAKSTDPKQPSDRHHLYERIAYGNALIEAEEQARRKWRGK